MTNTAWVRLASHRRALAAPAAAPRVRHDSGPYRTESNLTNREKSHSVPRVTMIVSKNGQIELPVDIRRLDDILPGQEFEFERLDCGEYRLKRLVRRHNEGVVKLLLACPVKGWFQPHPRTETTDNIKLPIFK